MSPAADGPPPARQGRRRLSARSGTGVPQAPLSAWYRHSQENGATGWSRGRCRLWRHDTSTIPLGDAGAGQTAKLFNNALLMMNQAAIAEIAELAARLGLDPAPAASATL